MSLTRRELTKKVNELELRLDVYDFNAELKEYWLSAYELAGNTVVCRTPNSNSILFHGELSDCKERFDWYKQWFEDGTVVVELNEEETEKVTKNKKKSK